MIRLRNEAQGSSQIRSIQLTMYVGHGVSPRLFDGARLGPTASAIPRHEPQRPTMLPLLLPLPFAHGQERGAWPLTGCERRMRALRSRSGTGRTALQAAAAEAGDGAEPDPSPPAARSGKGRRDKPKPPLPVAAMAPPPPRQQQQQSALPADVSGRIDAYLATLNDEQQGAVLCSSPSVRVKAGPGR